MTNMTWQNPERGQYCTWHAGHRLEVRHRVVDGKPKYEVKIGDTVQDRKFSTIQAAKTGAMKMVEHGSWKGKPPLIRMGVPIEASHIERVQEDVHDPFKVENIQMVFTQQSPEAVSSVSAVMTVEFPNGSDVITSLNSIESIRTLMIEAGAKVTIKISCPNSFTI